MEKNNRIERIAADIGGTFTDIALITNSGELVTKKIPSTPENYADAVTEGMQILLSELNANYEELLEVYCNETGLPAGRSRGELKRTIKSKLCRFW